MVTHSENWYLSFYELLKVLKMSKQGKKPKNKNLVYLSFRATKSKWKIYDSCFLKMTWWVIMGD